MPQIELKYSEDIKIDIDELFTVLQQLLATIDPSSGVCKCRAYAAKFYNPSHVLLQISLLQKPERDELFMKNVMHENTRGTRPIY